MRDLCILFLHHKAHDRLTEHNYRLLKRRTSSTVVPLTFNQGLQDKVVISKDLCPVDTSNEWRAADALVWGWFNSTHRIDANRYFIYEYDMACLKSPEEFLQEVWNEDVTGSVIQTPKSNPDWPWFTDEQSAPLGAKDRAGITPFAGVMLSYDAMRAMSELAKAPEYREAYCELRVGTLALRSGFKPVPLRHNSHMYIDWTPVTPNGPGIWHKVTDLWDINNYGIPYKVGGY